MTLHGVHARYRDASNAALSQLQSHNSVLMCVVYQAVPGTLHSRKLGMKTTVVSCILCFVLTTSTSQS